MDSPISSKSPWEPANPSDVRIPNKGSDYDNLGALLAGFKPDARGHLPDTYKLPNHITFSTDSVYNDGGAGSWQKISGTWYFTPGPTNLKHHSMEELRQYFRKHEPNSVLVDPTTPGASRG